MVRLKILLCAFLFLFSDTELSSQTGMINLDGRNVTSLNGKWNALIDPTNTGEWHQVWKEPIAKLKTDFFEYSFIGGPILNVPGGFSTQLPELTYLEGTVWYKRKFFYKPNIGRRVFIHFGAVNYLAKVNFNGEFIGSHEGGFTPFQFEVTDKVKDGENSIVVSANNHRLKDGIPGLGYDWFNYGGITRDVTLIETSGSFIEDYFIQLKKNTTDQVLGWVKIDGAKLSQKVQVIIPELKVNYTTQANELGYAKVYFKSKFILWSPSNPKLYKVNIITETDTISDEIGFRSIETKGSDIYLNGKKIFLKGINFHEEAPFRAARAFSDADALLLLNWSKELGCNMVRLAHYPHSENVVKLAEKMGLLVWSELPVYQHIEFYNPIVLQKMELMLNEMIKRDRNRCEVAIWCLSNETYPSTPNRNEALIEFSAQSRLLDSTRLITFVSCVQNYNSHTFDVWDPLYNYCDFIAINECLGWYQSWQGKPSETKWKLLRDDKPVIISEFG